MNFSDILTRGPGVTDPSWWNSLRDAGMVLQNLLVPTRTSIVNGQSSAASISGLLFDSASLSSIKIVAEVRQETASAELVCLVNITLLWRALSSSWDILWDYEGDDPGMVFSVSTVGTLGQVKYTTGTISGSGYVGTIKPVLTQFGA